MRETDSNNLPSPSSIIVWPLPELYGRKPVAVNDPATKHRGIDLAYPRREHHDLVMQYPPGSEHGTDDHFMPRWVPVFAVHAGEITYAGDIGQTHSIVINHDNGWATLYSNLEHMFATPTTTFRRRALVKAGDVLGYVGAMHPGMFKALHFELWRRGNEYRDDSVFAAIDPTHHMKDWLLLPWTDDRLTPIQPHSSPLAA